MELVQKIIESIITNTLVVTILGFIFSKVYERGTNFFFEKKLETYKAELQSISQVEDDIRNKKLYESNKFAEIKHNVYPRLYKKCVFAYSMIGNLQGIRATPTFEDFTKKDIQEYLEERNLLDGIKSDFIDKWDSDRLATSAKLQKKIIEWDYYKSESVLSKARNYYLLNELYLSDQLVDLLKDFFSSLTSIQVFNNFKIIEKIRDKDMAQQNSLDNNRAEELLTKIKEIMKKDIKIGYLI